VDANDTITLWNPAAGKLFGLAPEEVFSRPLSMLIDPKGDRCPLPGGSIMGVLREAPIFGPVEADFLTRTEGRKRLELVAYPVYGTERKAMGATVILRSTEESRKYWEGAFRAEQLALVGQIASGLAHEIGTPLNVISGNAEYVLAKLADFCPTVDEDPSCQPLRDELTTIVDQADRIAILIRKLLDFARPTPSNYEGVEVASLLQNVLSLLGPTLERAGVEVRIEAGKDMPPLWGDRHQLEQVLVNLMVNAQHAMPGGGRLSVRAGAEGGRIAISVKDSGAGMPPQIQDRIFEPFFTTKESSVGTGLGLTVCQRIVSEHKGAIRVLSSPGAGSTFTVELPAKGD